MASLMGRASVAGDRSGLGIAVILLLLVLLAGAALISLISGPTGVGLQDLVTYLGGEADASPTRTASSWKRSACRARRLACWWAPASAFPAP
jgi:hypothetical protein